MIRVSIKAEGEQAALNSAKTLDERILKAADTGLKSGLLMTVGIAQREFIQDGARVKGEYLPGARLHSVTGNLRRQMNTGTKRTADHVEGFIGNTAKYAAFHEFGFHGVQNVRAHSRVMRQLTDDENWGGEDIDTRRPIRNAAGELLGFKESRKASAKFQKKGFALVQFVKAHARKLNYPGKPFVRPALLRMQPVIIGEIVKELNTLK